MNTDAKYTNAEHTMLSASIEGILQSGITPSHRFWDQVHESSDVSNFIGGEPAQTIEDIRHKRNQLLDASDWTLMADSPLTDAQKLAWTNYRQVLRDITNDDRTSIVWPLQPG